MDLHFLPVTAENRAAVTALSLLPEQDGFIESVPACLAEAAADSRWRPVGIYDGDTLVGFSMYGSFEEYPDGPRVWLDRLLIDKACQHRGYGRAAVIALACRLRAEYGEDRIFLSVYDDNPTAIHLYQKLGFAFNGELDTHGEKIMVQTRQSANA